MSTTLLDVQAVRRRFSSLQGDFVFLDAPGVYDSVQIDDVFGSVVLGAGQTALLYSNGVPSTHLTLLGLLDKLHRTVDLKLPVFSAVSTPDGAHAIALLRPQAGSKQPGAFAVVPVAKDLPSKIQGTQAVTVPLDVSHGAPAMVAISDTRALVTVSDGASVNVAYLVSMPELTVDPFALDSVPLLQASGIVAEANQAFVAQRPAAAGRFVPDTMFITPNAKVRGSHGS